MIIYLIAYLLVGLFCVLVFSKPIKDKLWTARVIRSIDDKFRWKYWAFVILLYLICILIWPFYLVVVYGEWKANRPMTDKQIEEWAEWRAIRDRRETLEKARKERVDRLKSLRGTGSTPLQKRRFQRFMLKVIRRRLREKGLKRMGIHPQDLQRYPAHLRKRLAAGGIWTPLVKILSKHKKRSRRKACCVVY